VPAPFPGQAQPPRHGRGLRLLLVEDDPADALLVRELLEDHLRADIVEAASLSAAAAVGGRPDCVLLDLGLPDALGMDALTRALQLFPSSAVLVLTGLSDEHRGVEAVAAGAQDYLVKGLVDGQLLSRSIRYAIERRRAEEQSRQLYESFVREAENARLERGLLPIPLVDDSVRVTAHYRPGRERALLGGDFYDLVQDRTGTVHALIGDVSGHGPDEAALGVCLRIAWRTLVLAGHAAPHVLSTMNELLVAERRSDEVFATVAMIDVDLDDGTGTLRLAGHPAPLLVGDGAAGLTTALPDDECGPALGLIDDADWPAIPITLPPTWTLLLFTDGLIEGRTGAGADRLGSEGLPRLVDELCYAGLGENLPQEIVRAVETLNGGPLLDDTAAVLVAGRARHA
jgi:serine phosphatase RsbU (regulator of sigma subunit)